MRKSLKAALLSAFIFPGVGHFFLKKHRTGTTLAGGAVAALALLIYQAVERALQIVDKITSGRVELDVAAISVLVSAPPAGRAAQLLNIASTVLLISWLIAILDSFRVGHALDKHDQS